MGAIGHLQSAEEKRKVGDLAAAVDEVESITWWPCLCPQKPDTSKAKRRLEQELNKQNAIGQLNSAMEQGTTGALEAAINAVASIRWSEHGLQKPDMSVASTLLREAQERDRAKQSLMA